MAGEDPSKLGEGSCVDVNAYSQLSNPIGMVVSLQECYVKRGTRNQSSNVVKSNKHDLSTLWSSWEKTLVVVLETVCNKDFQTEQK